MFLGTIKQAVEKEDWVSITAYDQLEILNKSEGSITYDGWSLTQLLDHITEITGMACASPKHMMETHYELPPAVYDKTWLDIIHEGIQATIDNGSGHYVLWDDFGNVCLHSEEWLSNRSNMIISLDNLESYQIKKDVTNLYNQVTVISEKTGENGEPGEREETVRKNDELIKKFGTINKSVTLQEGENAEVRAEAELTEAEKNVDELSLNGVTGDPTVRGGTPVKVDFFSRDNREYIRGFYRVKTCKHHFEGGYHSMDLTCEVIKMENDWTNRNIEWGLVAPKLELPEGY